MDEEDQIDMVWMKKIRYGVDEEDQIDMVWMKKIRQIWYG